MKNYHISVKTGKSPVLFKYGNTELQKIRKFYKIDARGGFFKHIVDT